MRAFATGPRVALAADARSDAHHRFATDVAAAAAPRRHVVGARRDAHARSPGVRARWALPRGFASGPPGVASAPSVVARASASDDRGPGFGFGSRALDASRLDARGRVPVGARTVILGIETSCDDTGAAVITGDGRVLGEAIASQGEIHAKWGGVVPNLAREAHENAIDDVVARARSPPPTFARKTSPRWPSPSDPGCPCACAWASSRRRTCVLSTACPSSRCTTWKRTRSSRAWEKALREKA
jgi:hypothetical protein